MCVCVHFLFPTEHDIMTSLPLEGPGQNLYCSQNLCSATGAGGGGGGGGGDAYNDDNDRLIEFKRFFSKGLLHD